MNPEIVVFTKFLFVCSSSAQVGTYFYQIQIRTEHSLHFGSAYECEKLFFTNNKLCEKVSGRPYRLLHL